VNVERAIEYLRNKRVLITGGAGFIGSNLAKRLLSEGVQVVVLDNLSTGKQENITPLLKYDNFMFIEGDITDSNACYQAVKGVDVISHQAALGSVPRSIEFPHNTHRVNATGYLNMLHTAKEAGVKRFVYASSSSVYGDSKISPKTIGSEGKLLSPYAVTKQLNEMYAKVYKTLHGVETIGLRYFNVFGPNQDPEGVYAAAIPKFLDKMITGDIVTIHGDGEQTRDFTFVDNAVHANILALATENDEAFGKVFNVACGQFLSLNNVISSIRTILEREGSLHKETQVVNGPERPGDIRDSLADISDTTKNLGYEQPVLFDEGIEKYIASVLNV
jgi:nucleoside-diphosphate-sugar epimerase